MLDSCKCYTGFASPVFCLNERLTFGIWLGYITFMFSLIEVKKAIELNGTNSLGPLEAALTTISPGCSVAGINIIPIHRNILLLETAFTNSCFNNLQG